MVLNLDKLGSITTYGMEKLKHTYMYVLLGLVLSTLGCIIGLPYVSLLSGWLFVFLIIITFGTLFLFLYRTSIYTYSLFTFVNGLVLVPLISSYLEADMIHIIIQSLIGTGIIVLLLTIYTFRTKKNFMELKTILFYILIGLIVMSLINMFFGSSLFSFLISACSMVLFSLYIVMDTQKVLYTNITPLEAACNLYLDILNIFISLLNILSVLNTKD